MSIRFPPPEVVARAWRVNVERLGRLAGGHGAQALVHTDGGRALVLKQVRRRDLPAEGLEAVLEAAWRAGHEHGAVLAAPLPQRGNSGFVLEWEGRRYYLTRFVEGERPSFRRAADVAAVAGALGRFHRTAGGLGPALAARLGLPERRDLRALCEGALDRHERLVEAIAALPRRRPGARLLGAGLPAVREHLAGIRAAPVVSRLLSGSRSGDRGGGGGGRVPAAGASVPVVLGHGDTHENNFLLGPAGAGRACALLDVESLEPRAGAEDLVVPLHYLGFYTRWAPEGLRRSLAAYEAERPLPAAERACLAFHLLLPRHWYRAARSLVKRNAALSDVRAWLKWRRGWRDLARQAEAVGAAIGVQ
ncbi:MAG: hypothetical protein Kow0059_05750 [Candidatus Sumerlaeia bacterium]